VIREVYIKGFWDGIMKGDESIKIILLDGFRGTRLLWGIPLSISFGLELLELIFILKGADKVIFFVFDLDVKLVGIIVPLPRGVTPILPLGPLLQMLLLGVDYELDPRQIRIVLIHIYGDLHPGGLESVGSEGQLVGIVDDVGRVVLVLLLVEEKDGFGC
jgi:hypothetical protein